MKLWSVTIQREIEETETLLLRREKEPAKEEIIKILREEHYIEDHPDTMYITIKEGKVYD